MTGKSLTRAIDCAAPDTGNVIFPHRKMALGRVPLVRPVPHLAYARVIVIGRLKDSVDEMLAVSRVNLLV
eukprot:COSAG03_NODE_12941_length_524_cov_0.847059_1_plen_69_part_01